MQALVSRDQLVGKSQARHQAPFLEPVDRAERTTEQDAFYASEGQDALREAILLVHPLHRPLGLLLYCRHSVDGVEHLVLLHWIPDVLLDEQTVGLRMNVL